MAVVYQHKKEGTNQVFYIGIGTRGFRPYDRNGRNKYWHSIVNKYGYDVEILFTDISRNEAESWERYLIGVYGRSVNNTGNLCNITEGGDASIGLMGDLNPRYGTKHTLETIAKMSAVKKGKSHTDVARLNMSAAKKGINNPHYGTKRSTQTKAKISMANTGKKFSDQAKAKMAIAKSKPVIDTSTNIIYESGKVAAKELNLLYNTLRGKLNGAKKNNTSLRYL